MNIADIKNHIDIKPRYCRLEKKPREEFGLYVVIDNNRVGHVSVDRVYK